MFMRNVLNGLGLLGVLASCSGVQPTPDAAAELDAGVEMPSIDGGEQAGDAGNDGGADACLPRTCEDVGADCGEVSDGCGGTLTCGEECVYQNPVLDSNGDPFCIQHEGTYYLYQPRAGRGEVVAFTSTDLVHWEAEGVVFSNAGMRYGGARPQGLWAPEVMEYEGTFYLYFVNVMPDTGTRLENRDIGVVASEDPLDFTGGEPEVLLDDRYVFLDPSPFHDPATGKLYILFKRRTPSMDSSDIRIRPMADPTTLNGAATTLIRGSDFPRQYDGIVEHPEMMRRDGVYYFLFAYGHGAKWDGYHVAYMTSSQPTRGFGDRRVLFRPTLEPESGQPIFAPGATSIVQDADGNDWALYRQKTMRAMGFGDRQVTLDAVRIIPDHDPPVIRGTATRGVTLPAPAAR